MQQITASLPAQARCTLSRSSTSVATNSAASGNVRGTLALHDANRDAPF